jgi:hypothetical protein
MVSIPVKLKFKFQIVLTAKAVIFSRYRDSSSAAVTDRYGSFTTVTERY